MKPVWCAWIFEKPNPFQDMAQSEKKKKTTQSTPDLSFPVFFLNALWQFPLKNPRNPSKRAGYKWPHLLCLTSTSPPWSTAAGGWAGYSKTSPLFLQQFPVLHRRPPSVPRPDGTSDPSDVSCWQSHSATTPLDGRSSRSPPSFPEGTSCWNEKSSPLLLKDFLIPPDTINEGREPFLLLWQRSSRIAVKTFCVVGGKRGREMAAL